MILICFEPLRSVWESPFSELDQGVWWNSDRLSVPCSLGVPVVWDQLPPVVHPPHMHLDPIIILRASPEIV
jgi:hypothetical protein